MLLIWYTLRFIVTCSLQHLKQHLQLQYTSMVSFVRKQLRPLGYTSQVGDYGAGNFVERESSSQSQVLPNGFLLLCVNSDNQRRPWRTSVPNTQALCKAAVALSIKEGPGMSLAVTTIHDRDIEAGQCFSDVRAYERVYICLWESRVDAMAIFSLVHWVLPALCCSVPRNMRKQPSTGSLAPWPRPSSSYTSGRHLWDSCGIYGRLSAKGDFFWRTPCSPTAFLQRWLMGSNSTVTLERYLRLIQGGGYHSGTSLTQSEPWNKYVIESLLFFHYKKRKRWKMNEEGNLKKRAVLTNVHSLQSDFL